jgi:hypothetical protein
LPSKRLVNVERTDFERFEIGRNLNGLVLKVESYFLDNKESGFGNGC